mmetsp:Transcript_6177/g.21962  ORF Transcript_6177/g.21962 Transcript_6177/m.21962 type:complete len:243 (+) Transcript_6177:235-963(+)
MFRVPACSRVVRRRSASAASVAAAAWAARPQPPRLYTDRSSMRRSCTARRCRQRRASGWLRTRSCWASPRRAGCRRAATWRPRSRTTSRSSGASRAKGATRASRWASCRLCRRRRRRTLLLRARPRAARLVVATTATMMRRLRQGLATPLSARKPRARRLASLSASTPSTCVTALHTHPRRPRTTCLRPPLWRSGSAGLSASTPPSSAPSRATASWFARARRSWPRCTETTPTRAPKSRSAS